MSSESDIKQLLMSAKAEREQEALRKEHGAERQGWIARAQERAAYESIPAPDLSQLDWDDLVDLGRKIAYAGQWILGDLACNVVTGYGEATLEKYAEAIGVEYSTLRGYKQVAQAYPPESVPRGTHPWSVYRELAAEPDRLELVGAKRMTVSEAKTIVLARRAVPPLPRIPRQPALKEPTVPPSPPLREAKAAKAVRSPRPESAQPGTVQVEIIEHLTETGEARVVTQLAEPVKPAEVPVVAATDADFKAVTALTAGQRREALLYVAARDPELFDTAMAYARG